MNPIAFRPWSGTGGMLATVLGSDGRPAVNYSLLPVSRFHPSHYCLVCHRPGKREPVGLIHVDSLAEAPERARLHFQSRAA